MKQFVTEIGYDLILETNFFCPMEGKNESDAENSVLKSAFARFQKSKRAEASKGQHSPQEFVRWLFEHTRDDLANPLKRQRMSEEARAKLHDRELILYGNEEHSTDECYWHEIADKQLDWRIDGRPWSNEYKVNGPKGIADWIFTCIFVVLRDETLPDGQQTQVGAVYYRYTPCACNVCMSATCAKDYEGCPHLFSQAKAHGVRGFQRHGTSPQILCPFRLRPYKIMSKAERAAKTLAGEDVWQTFFNGVQWVSTATEDEGLELTWSDWQDPTEAEQLRRGHAVALSMSEGQYFAVQMEGTGNPLEDLGWCVYEVVGHARQLTEDLKITNKSERVEHEIAAGTTVVEGRPLVTVRTDGDGRVYHAELGRVDEQGDESLDQTFPSHLVICVVNTIARARPARRGAGRRSGRRTSNRREQEWLVPQQEVQRVGKILALMRDKRFVEAMDMALEDDEI